MDLKNKVGFAIGTGRCGTNFISKVIELEPNVASAHERNPLNEAFHRYCKWYNLPVDNEGFLQAKDYEVREDINSKLFSFESSPYLSLSIKELYDHFGAKFILLVRAPELVVNSFLRKRWYEKDVLRANVELAPGYQECRQFHHFLARVMPSGEKFQQWNQMSRVGKLAWYWNTLNAKVLEQFEAIPTTHWRVEKLEDLSYSRYLEIAEFLGFQPQVTKKKYDKLAQSRPNGFSDVPTIATWTASEIAEFESEVATMAERFSYEYKVTRLSVAQSKQPVAAQPPIERLKSLIYLSGGNLPSQMAHTGQIAKMAQALSQKVKNFELVTSGDILSALKGMDSDFKSWYALHSDFKLVRLPIHIKANFPFSNSYRSKIYPKLAVLYACLKAPSLVYTRTPQIVALFLKIGMPVLWEWHEPIKEKSTYCRFFNDKDLIGVVTTSSQLADNYIKLGLDPEKVLVAQNAVELSNFLPHQEKDLARQKVSLTVDKKIVLYSGHLYEIKGIKTILEVARLMPEYQFVLVGGWVDDINRVKKICQETDLRNVHFIGHVPQSELASYLYTADILLLPTSKYWNQAEVTNPLKLFEYMAVRRPIVASALPNIMTILRDRENALLAEPDDPLSFQKAIQELLENPTLANAIAERGFQEVQNYTWDSRTDKILQFASERLSATASNRTKAWKSRFSIILNTLN